MPSWRKLIVSGSDSTLNSLKVTTYVSASSFSGNFTGSFKGDGSQLTNVTTTVEELSSVAQTFTSVTSSTVNHNLDTDRPLVQVYNTDAEQIVPKVVKILNNNNVIVEFDTPESGKIVVAKGGHIVTASVPWDNLTNVPSGLVSSSAQIASDISGAFTSVSSSIASDITGLDSRLDTIEGKTLVSSSIQIKLQDTLGNLSGSRVDGAVQSAVTASYILYSNVKNVPDFLLETEFNTYTGSIEIFSGSISSRVSNLEQFSSSLNSTYATDAELSSVSSSLASSITGLDSRLDTLEGKTLVSSSIQIKLQNTSGNLSGSRVDGAVASATSASHALNSDNTITASYAGNANLFDGKNSTTFATTGSNTFIGTQIFNDIVVNGTGSFSYIESVTGSAKIIGDAFIILNNNVPAQAYGGIKVIDSGSTDVTASLLWDGIGNHWVYENISGSTYGAAGFLSGPRSTNLNSISYPTQYKVIRSQGEDHLYDSNITDNDTNVSISIPLSVTGNITASAAIKAIGGFEGNLSGNASTATTASYVDFTNIGNKPELVSSSAQITLSQISGTTFSSSTLTFPSKVVVSGSLLIQRGEEKITVSPTAATGTVNFDVLNQSIVYYTLNATGDWTLNIRGNSTTTINNSMEIGRSLTLVFMVTNGATPYRQTGLTVDGSSVSPKWQGGLAPTSGNANSIDSYTVVLIKTANNTFTVLESQTRFA